MVRKLRQSLPQRTNRLEGTFMSTGDEFTSSKFNGDALPGAASQSSTHALLRR